MIDLQSKIPAFALPFVTRSLRGGRQKRFTFLSLALAALTVLVGAWLALGPGELEQSFRTGLDLEDDEWNREQVEYVIVEHDLDAYRDLRRAQQQAAQMSFAGNVAAYGDGIWTEVSSEMSEAYTFVEQAARTNPGNYPRLQRLRAEATDLAGLDDPTPIEPDPMNYYGFSWSNPSDVERLEAILARGGVPEVELYASPLSILDAIEIIGFIAGTVLGAMLLVFAPLLGGIQQAQEVHENTLQPLTGTALSPMQLALGLAAGPAVVVALFAAPQAAILGLSALATGTLFQALLLGLSLLTGGAFLFAAAQMTGQIAGRRRTPGIVGIVLLLALGSLAAAGLGLGLAADHQVTGFLALLPQSGPAFLLRDAFGHAVTTNTRVDAFLAIGVGVAGFGTLTLIASKAIANLVGGRYAPTLSRTQVLIAALVGTLMVVFALPVPDGEWSAKNDDIEFFFGTLALLSFPYALLLMTRVPHGDMPTKLRRLDLRVLLGELGAMLGMHFVLASMFLIDVTNLGFHPVAIVWLGWSFVVLGLLAVRAVALPVTVPGAVWSVFCLLAVVVGFVHGVAWSAESGMDAQDVFALAHLSPVLGLVQAGLAVWIPWSLVRRLNRSVHSIRG